jgi:peptidoglycan/LPS O-acetylase OafA/YrhL
MQPAKNRKDTQNLPQLKQLKLASLSRGNGSSLYFHHFQNHQAPNAPMTRTVELPALVSERRHDLDALRAFAMLLGIALHISLSLGGTPWMVMDSRPSGAFYWLYSAIHGFRMQLFFIVSGYFTALLLARRGLVPMLQNRSLRILVPCFLGLATLVPLTNSVIGWASAWNASHPGEALQAAIVRGDNARLEHLLDTGADIEQPDSRLKVRPLGWAVLWGDEPATRLLLERGANAMGTTGDGSTALGTAAFLGRPDLLKLLVAKGGDPLAANASGITPMMSTFADHALTKGILRAVKGSEPDDSEMAAIDKGRNEVRTYLGGKMATAGLAGLLGGKSKESPPPPAAPPPVAKTAPLPAWLTNYTRSLASDRYRVTVNGWTWQLFEDATFNYLWFLWILMWLVALFALVAALAGRFAPGLVAWQPRLIPSLVLAIILTLLPQFCMAVPVFPGSPPGIIGPDTSMGILPKPHVLAYYAVFFFFGTIYYRNHDTSARLGAGWRLWLPLALLVLFPAALNTLDNRLLNTPLQVVYNWMMALGMMGLFHSVLNRQSPAIRYISDSSYWLYLAHLPLVIALQALVCDWPWPAWAKFLFMLSVSTILLLLSFQLLVRDKPLGWLLNGRKTSPSQPKPSAA